MHTFVSVHVCLCFFNGLDACVLSLGKLYHAGFEVYALNVL